MEQEVHLGTPLSIKSAFRFPLQHALARKEVLIGAALLLVPVVGWLLNMGHRIEMVHRMHHGLPAWPAWNNWGRLFKHGVLTCLGMIEYHAPASICFAIAAFYDIPLLYGVGAVLWVMATMMVPGYMTHYCVHFDASEIFNPFKATRRVFEGGLAYLHAWMIALTAMCLSFLGLLVVGIGFLPSSVWFWQVAGFSFATVFTQTFHLHQDSTEQAATS